MKQIPPPQLPWHRPEPPSTPTVIPRLPTRVQRPGRQTPLPDAVAVRPCVVPVTAPPFDDETPQAASDHDYEGNGAVSAAADRPPAEDQVAPGRAAPDPPAHDPPAHPPASEPRVTRPVPDSDESDRTRPGPPAGWPSQFAQVLAEALAGSRPARQLTPWTTEQARKRIRQLSPMLATDQRPKVRRVMTSAPAANVLEMTAVVGFGPRIRVLALRLEREQARADHQGGGRWCCTAIESA